MVLFGEYPLQFMYFMCMRTMRGGHKRTSLLGA